MMKLPLTLDQSRVSSQCRMSSDRYSGAVLHLYLYKSVSWLHLTQAAWQCHELHETLPRRYHNHILVVEIARAWVIDRLAAVIGPFVSTVSV